MIVVRDEGGGEVRAALTNIRAALFILATLLLALFGIGLASFPKELHSVPLHLHEQGIRQLSAAGSPSHRLEIDRDGQMTLDGRALCDLLDLRQEFDRIANGRESILKVRPDPELRYDRFIEIMAVAARASIQNLKLDLQPIIGRGSARNPPRKCPEKLVL